MITVRHPVSDTQQFEDIQRRSQPLVPRRIGKTSTDITA
jgi:hypothetical protein